jgi:hypothetical protein
LDLRGQKEWENITEWGASEFVLLFLRNIIYVVQIEDEIGVTCGTHNAEEKGIEGF